MIRLVFSDAKLGATRPRGHQKEGTSVTESGMSMDYRRYYRGPDRGFSIVLGGSPTKGAKVNSRASVGLGGICSPSQRAWGRQKHWVIERLSYLHVLNWNIMRDQPVVDRNRPVLGPNSVE